MTADSSHESNSVNTKLDPVYAVKAYAVVEVEPHWFLTSVQECGEWSASRPEHFISRDKGPGTQWVACWVGSKTDLDALQKT
jgi:hypothetical protein